VTLRVVGAGLGQTGTSSLKVALEQLLGGRCHHMAEVLADPERHLPLWAPVLRGEEVDWERIFAGCVAQVDFPGAAFWPEIKRAFPDTLVILSTPPAEAWYRSAASTIFQLDDDHGSSPSARCGGTVRVRRPLRRPVQRSRRDDCCLRAAQHHRPLRGPPDRFLEWTVGDGWQPLCDRLGLPVPEETFPWTNTTAEFRAHNRLD
jgi:hypothetical protein